MSPDIDVRHLGLPAKILGCIFAVPCAWFLAHYWNIAPFIALFVPLLALMVFCLFRMSGSRFTRAEVVSWAAFSTLLSISLVLGKHIVIDAHTGTKEACYINAYGSMDILAFIFMALGIFWLVINAYKGLSSLGEKLGIASRDAKDGATDKRKRPYHFNVRFFLIACAILFICWLPYLLAYWPGFVFGDSLNSIRQALGINGFNVRHPVVYTLFIKGCIDFVGVFGLDTTAGIALYTIIQMIVLAASFAFMICWLGARFNLPFAVKAILGALFALTPYVATFSVTVWKDPIFCASFIIVTVLLADAVSGKSVFSPKSCIILYTISAAALCFSRKNGVYSLFLLALIIALVLIANHFRDKKERAPLRQDGKKVAHKPHIEAHGDISCVALIQVPTLRGILISTLAVCVTSIVTVNALYGALSVDRSEEKIETYGVLMNQMAAVAAYDGDLSDANKKYLDSIFPLDEYANAYHPCIIDPLKWSKSFNRDALENGFLKNWASIGVKNPGIYFQAWELQTAGWWCLNNSMVNGYLSCNNLSLGHPRNTTNDYPIGEKYHLGTYNLLGSDDVRSVLVQDTWSIPVAYINWFVLFICICGFLRRRGLCLIPIVPTIGLIAVLLVASPILYWARYGAMEQFLIPFYICWLLGLFVSVKTKADNRKLEDIYQGRRRIRLDRGRQDR